MRVTNIEVKFHRNKQPAKFEEAGPGVELSAALDEGEDHVAVAARLMTDVCRIAYAALGYDIPTEPAAKLAALANTTAVVESINVPNAEAFKERAEALPEESKRRKRRTKAEIAADKAAEAPTAEAPPAEEPTAAASGGTPSDDIPDDGAGRAISDNPEDRKNPDDETPAGMSAANAQDDIPEDPSTPAADSSTTSSSASGDIPDDTPPDDAPLSDEDLQSEIAATISGKKITPARVKEIMAGYGAQRTSEIPQDKRRDFIKLITAPAS